MVITLVLILIAIPTSMVILINNQIKPQVQSIAKVEASNAATNVIIQSINSLQIDTTDLVYLTYDESGKVIGINYNTMKLNQILATGLEASAQSLAAISNGEEDPNTHIVYYDRGIIHSIPLGYFSGIAIFAQMGPSIDVHLKVLHTNYGEIQVTTTPYGINSTVVQIDLMLQTQLTVITPFLVETMPIECRIPLVIQVAPGELPSMLFEKII